MVMKKRNVILSLKAKSSLVDIIAYLKKNASSSIAKYVRKGLIEKCKSLGDFSGYSKERYLEDLPEEYYSTYKWDYLIIYKVSDKEVRILNIIHTRRNPIKRKDL